MYIVNHNLKSIGASQGTATNTELKRQWSNPITVLQKWNFNRAIGELIMRF